LRIEPLYAAFFFGRPANTSMSAAFRGQANDEVIWSMARQSYKIGMDWPNYGLLLAEL
jgi:hypothetical protein